MLHIFRSKGAQNTVYGGLILVMSIGLIFTMGPGANAGPRTGLSAECVAKVYGACVSPRSQTTSMRFTRMAQQGESMGGMGDQVRKTVVDGLVERELLVREADRLGLSTSDNELKDFYARGLVHFSPPAEAMASPYGGQLAPPPIAMQDFTNPKTKDFDPKLLQRFADRTMGSLDGFNEWQSREILAAKVREAVQAPVRVSDDEAWDNYSREKSTTTLSYVRVKDSFVVDHLVSITPAEVDAFAKAHTAEIEAAAKKQEDDNTPKEERIRHILISVAADASPEERGNAKRKLAEAWTRLKAGETFSSVARAMSTDPGSGKKGGWYTTSDLPNFVTEFKTAAEALKPGERTNGAVETQFGWHILERDDVSKKDALLTQSKKDIAAAMLRDSKAQEATAKLTAAIQAGWNDGKTPVEEVIAAALRPYAKKAGKPADVPIKARAAEDVAKDKEAAEAHAGKADKAKNAAAEKYVDLTEDKDRPEVLQTTVYRASGTGLQGLAPADESALVNFAFAAKDGEAFKESLKAKDGRFIVRVKEHLSAKRENFDANKDAFVASLVSKKRAEALALYIKDLKERAKSDIHIDERYIKTSKKDESAADN